MPLKGNGNYVITHVKSGKRLSFVRGEVTNLYPVAKGTPVEIQVRSFVREKLRRRTNGVRTDQGQPRAD